MRQFYTIDEFLNLEANEKNTFSAESYPGMQCFLGVILGVPKNEDATVTQKKQKASLWLRLGSQICATVVKKGG